MNSVTRSLVTPLCLTGALVACASIPPSQLIETRTAYVASNDGLAGKLAPTDLYEAKKSLDQANQEFDAHGWAIALGNLTREQGRYPEAPQ